MHWWPSVPWRRKWVSGRIVYSLLKIVLKCLFLARKGRTDILWSVNKHARAVTKWTKSCARRLARLISYNHHTCENRFAFSEVKRSFQSARCARNRLQFHTVQQLSMQVYAWIELPLSLSWIWLFKYFFFPKPIRQHQRSNTRKLVAWHHMKQSHPTPNWRSNQAQHSCYVSSNAKSSFLIKMIINGRSPTLRECQEPTELLWTGCFSQN